jgi:competence protein ComEC
MTSDLTADRPADPPADLRLVLPALATWAGAFAGTAAWRSPLSVGLVAAVSAGALVLSLLGAAGLAARARAGPAGRRPAALLATLLTVGAAAGGLAAGSLAVLAALQGPVDELAASRATVSGRATVLGDPVRPAATVAGSRRAPPLLVVPMRLEVVQARGRTVRVRSRVVGLLHGGAHRAAAGLLPGQRVRVAGRLGPVRDGPPAAAVLRLTRPPEHVGRPPPLQTAAGDLRAGLRRAVVGLPPDERGLLPGLVLGDTSRLPPALQADFRTAGLTHLVAVSGANLAIVSGFVLLVGRWSGLRGRALPLLAAGSIAGFVVLARPEPSVLRAAAMGALALLALATGRRRRSLAALAATVVVLLLVDPWLARSYGFVLSALATGALVTLATSWTGRWSSAGVPRPLAAAFAAPLAAQLVCAPVVVLLSDQVSLVAVPANLLAGPAVAPATVLGVLATVASAVHSGTAAGLAWLAGGFVWWIVHVARWSAGLPSAAVGWPGSLAGAALLGAATLVAVTAARSAGRRPVPAAACAVVLVVALVVPARAPGWPPRDWVLAVCDVGQGDALVLPAGSGAAVVVDAGPDPSAVDRCLRRLGVRSVAVLLLTHLHADHVEGVPGVLRGRRVGELQVGLLDEPPAELARVQRWAAAARVPVTRAHLGDRVRVGPLSWTVLWPARVVHAGSEPNNASTVLLVRVRGVSLLLTGDVEPEAQRVLLARGGLGRVDVLKVAHHGSAYQDPDLLAKVRPRLAVVSAGEDNGYGHPARSTLAALRRAGAVVGRTDRDGTLLVAGSGRSVRLVTRGG